MPSQSELFERPAPTDASELVAVHLPRAALGRLQTTFNQLSRQVRQARTDVETWRAFEADYRSRVAADIEPKLAAMTDCRRRLVRKLDALLSDPQVKLPVRLRRRLPALILAMADEVLADDADAEIERIKVEHGGLSPSEQDALDLEMTEAMLSGLFGEDVVDGHKATDRESLLRHVHERLDAEQQAREAARQRRAEKRRSKRGDAPDNSPAARRERAAQEASASLRDVYRQLASALHPDRASGDAAEQARRTALMQQVNLAYERKDLLGLLTLQIEIEQIGSDHFAQMPEQRLKRFVDVLRQQLQSLHSELQTIRMPMLEPLGLSPDPRLRVADVEQAFDEQAQALADAVDQAEADLAALDQPTSRKSVLESLCDELDDDGIDDPMFYDMLFDVDAEPRPTARRQRTGKRRRS